MNDPYRRRLLGLAGAVTFGLGLAAAGAGPASAATSYPGTCSAASRNGVALTSCLVNPGDTNPTTFASPNTVDAVSTASNDHRAVVPTATGARKNVLVVFLGGTFSSPSVYDGITAEAASQGYGVVNLRIPNDKLVATACGNTDSCYTTFRGSLIYGPNVTVPGVNTAGYTGTSNVTLGNSVMNRLVSLLDTQSLRDPWWSQFLTADANSPYRTDQHPNGAVPTWSKIVFSGHSQGGGHAAFIGLTVPTARRIVSFSGPTDSVPSGTSGYDRTVTWVKTSQTAAQLGRFWGLRDTEEGTYGTCTSYDWRNYGIGTSTGTLCPTSPADETTHAGEVFVGQGAGAQGGSHFLVKTDRPNPAALYAHDSNALDNNAADGSTALPFSTDRYVAWDYLFTAGGTD